MKKHLFIILSVLILSCSKGKSGLQSGIWTLNSYTYGGHTFTTSNTTVEFGSNDKMTITEGNHKTIYNYHADDKVITINGSTGNYKATKNKLEVDLVLYPVYADPNDPAPVGSSSLSK